LCRVAVTSAGIDHELEQERSGFLDRIRCGR
jgi:hypothetical protein